jgi:hypothetical protein
VATTGVDRPRVAVFRSAGRSSRTHAAAIVGQLRAGGLSAVECADRGDLPPDHGLSALEGDYGAVLQIGEGAGAAAALAAALDIPLIHASFGSPADVADGLRKAMASR